MKTLNDMLLLGDPRLYETSTDITQAERQQVSHWVADLHNVMEEVRARYKFGRSIAAPQLGIQKNLIYMNIDKPVVLINPKYLEKSEEMFEVWDDCMCLPHLFVKVNRHKRVRIQYKNENWEDIIVQWADDMAELIQHEMDHLEGILCTMRAIDNKSFKYRINV